jgi:hypothetical protein
MYLEYLSPLEFHRPDSLQENLVYETLVRAAGSAGAQRISGASRQPIFTEK